MDINSLKIAIDTSDAVKAKNNLDNLGKSSKSLESNVSSAGNTLLSFKGIIAGIATGAVISNYIKFSDTITNIESKLKLATKTTNEFAIAQRELYTIAQNSRVSLESTVDLYSKLSISTKELNISQQNLLRVTQSINKAGIIGGGTKESINAALVQLGQGFASGTLRGEELNSVMEQTPRLARAIAEGMGVSVGELRKLGEQGLITSEKVVNSLIKQSDDIDREFGKMTATVSQSFTVLENSIISATGVIDKITGTSGVVAKAMMGWSYAIDSVSKSFRLAFGDIDTMTDKTDLIAKRAELVKERITVKNDKFFWDSDQKEKISAIDKELVKVSGRLATLFLEEEKVGVASVKTSDNWSKLADSTKRVIDPIRQVREEYTKLREELKAQKLDTPENIKAINLKEIEAISSVTKKANAETIKSQKELEESLNKISDAYSDMAKMGMTEYDKSLYEIKLKTIDFINTTGDLTTALEMQTIAENELNKKQSETNLKEQQDLIKARNEEIDKGLVAITREYDLKEKQAGLLLDEITKNSELTRLYNEKAKIELQAQKEKGEITDEYYNTAIAYEDELMSRTLFRLSQTGQVIESVSSGMKSSMMDFFDYTSQGFGDLNSLAIDLGNQIYKSITQQMIVNPLVNAISGAATSYFSGGFSSASASPSIGTSAPSTYTDMYFNAKGGLYNSPSLSNYSNQVVSKPTMFAFASGGVPNMGVMGEKNGGSPEAIIPLTRTANGDLGVKSIDGGKDQNVKIEIINNSGEQMQVSNAKSRTDISGQVISIVIDAIKTNKQGMRQIIGGNR